MWIEADTLYDIVNAVAAAGWLLLVLLPQGKVTMLLVRNGALSITLAVGYVILLVLYFPGAEGGFASLQDVMQLFANPYLLVAGWLHYLAFDLLLGCWELRDAQRRGLPHLALVPSLVCTFLFGPAGFLLYLATRQMLTFRVSATKS